MSYTFNTQSYANSLGTGGSTVGNLTVNTGDTIIVMLDAFNCAAFSTLAISDTAGNAYSYANVLTCNPASGIAATLTASPTGTSATLNAAFSGTTGSYLVVFSDGELRVNTGTLTNGTTTALSWSATAGLLSGALTGTPSTSITLFPAEILSTLAFYALNAVAGSYQISASLPSSSSLASIWAANYSGISGPPVAVGSNWYASSVTGANVITTGNLTVTGQSMLFGFCFNFQDSVGGTPLVGTSPTVFNGRGGIPWATNNPAQAEDALVSATAPVTFGSPVENDYYFTTGMAFALGSVSTPNGPYPLESAEYF